ncbi:AtpZ/AtpI family protein [SAR202 cluster bacterium AD-804-J14_MRT_500m]|nr:AtpZ/AtpI family protein [SAR202 cluster bacterium AD-804-J14_MRT_500m]
MSGWILALRLAGLGWYVALCIVFGIAGGLWMDSKIDTAPIFMLSGTIFGVVLAFFGMYKMVGPLLQIAKNESSNYRKDRG